MRLRVGGKINIARMACSLGLASGNDTRSLSQAIDRMDIDRNPRGPYEKEERRMRLRHVEMQQLKSFCAIWARSASS